MKPSLFQDADAVGGTCHAAWTEPQYSNRRMRMRQFEGRIGRLIAFPLMASHSTPEGTHMRRQLLPVMVPVMITGTIALLIGGAAAGAHSNSSARSAKAANIQLKRVGHFGKILVNGHGQTLYLFEKDKHGKSSCNGQCAQFWPPALTTGKPHAGSGVSSSKLGTTKRKNGQLQVTYAGHPLYAYAGDGKAGQANGEGSQNFGAAWYVMNAKGSAVKH